MTDLSDWTLDVDNVGAASVADIADWTVAADVSGGGGGGGGGGGTQGLVGWGPISAVSGTAAPTFLAPTTAGNLLVMLYIGANGILPAVSGTGWTAATRTAGAPAIAIFYRANCGAGEAAPGITSGTGGTAMAAVLGEWAGFATSSPLDNAQNAFHNTSHVSTLSVTAAGANTQTGELFLLAAYIANDANSLAWTDTYNNGTPTLLGNRTIPPSGLNAQSHFAYGLTTANAAADSYTSAVSVGVGFYAVASASFKHA